MKWNRALTISIAFTAVLSVLGAATLLLPDRAFSPNENRYLQTTPHISGAALLDGTAQEEITAYMSDQFPLRDGWTALGSAIKKALGRRDIGGAYIGKNGYYFEKITDADLSRTRYTRNLTILRSFLDNHAGTPSTVMLVPSAGTVLTEQLPPFAEIYDYAALHTLAAGTLQNSRVPDLRADLAKTAAVTQVYYRTDHHWTTDGAAVAYTALTGNAAPALTTVADDFLGTLYSDTLDAAATPDAVRIAPVADTVTATADGKPIPVYDTAKLAEKDKYLVFFGGNHGIVTLNGGTQNGKTLLIIKDSFANCLAPMLTADYETVVMLDLRYYSGNVSELMAQHAVTDILVCFEMDKFAGDSNLAKLME